LLRYFAIALVLLAPSQARGQDAMSHSVDQLRHAVGTWSVVTDFLNPDGTVAGSYSGTYVFEWVIPDRIVRGHSEIPQLKQKSGILFYVSAARKVIEMASVGADGQLFVMTGPLGGETRQTEFVAADGTRQQLRFTRSNVTPGRFESRMERSSDGGKTWVPGNRQVFQRQPASRRRAGRSALPSSGRNASRQIAVSHGFTTSFQTFSVSAATPLRTRREDGRSRTGKGLPGPGPPPG
jgi:hypothetical protein